MSEANGRDNQGAGHNLPRGVADAERRIAESIGRESIISEIEGNREVVAGGAGLELDPESSVISYGGTRSPATYSELHAVVGSKDAMFFLVSSRIGALTEERHYLFARRDTVSIDAIEKDAQRPEIVGVLTEDREAPITDSDGHKTFERGKIFLSSEGKVTISALNQQTLDVVVAHGAQYDMSREIQSESIVRSSFKKLSRKKKESDIHPQKDNSALRSSSSQVAYQHWLPKSEDIRNAIEL